MTNQADPQDQILPSDIEQLRIEAGAAGDAAQVELCTAALEGGCSEAWARCCRIIRDTRQAAQDE